MGSEKASPLMLAAKRASLGGLMEGDRVVKAGGGGARVVGKAFEEHTERARLKTPGGGDARGQAIAGGGADDENVAGAGD
jgi:hypothetical protein